MEYLEEKVEMHDTLNPSIWAKDNHLRPEVKDKLEEIVNEFLIELEENEIPIVENPPLARALFASTELDQTIPTEHFQAVAEVINYVMQLKNQ